MQVALWLAPLHHDHWVGLSEQGPSCSQLSQFYQFNNNLARVGIKMEGFVRLWHHLLIEINQLPVRQFERLDGLEDGVPVTIVDVCRERILRIHRVQGD